MFNCPLHNWISNEFQCPACISTVTTGGDLPIAVPVSSPTTIEPKIYIASKTKHADKWKALRASGVNIISSWIDEAGEGETVSMEILAVVCIYESQDCDAMIVYREDGDYLKGAFIEMGVAITDPMKPVLLVGPVLPAGSVFTHLPNVFAADTIDEAVEAIRKNHSVKASPTTTSNAEGVEQAAKEHVQKIRANREDQSPLHFWAVIEAIEDAYIAGAAWQQSQQHGLRECIEHAEREWGGAWVSCSGCHESVEGQEVGHNPYSEIFKCYLGSGCGECGGIGAIWHVPSAEESQQDRMWDDGPSYLLNMALEKLDKRGWKFLANALYDRLEVLPQQPQVQQGMPVDRLKDILEAFQWTWDNMQKPHTADHFNIPANGIADLERLIDESNEAPQQTSNNIRAHALQQIVEFSDAGSDLDALISVKRIASNALKEQPVVDNQDELWADVNDKVNTIEAYDQWLAEMKQHYILSPIK